MQGQTLPGAGLLQRAVDDLKCSASWSRNSLVNPRVLAGTRSPLLQLARLGPYGAGGGRKIFLNPAPEFDGFVCPTACSIRQGVLEYTRYARCAQPARAEKIPQLDGFPYDASRGWVALARDGAYKVTHKGGVPGCMNQSLSCL